MRLLGARNARDGVRLLDDLRLLCVVVPELAQAKGVIQPKEHYWDVFDHQVEAVGWVDAMFDDADCEEYPLDIVPRFDGMHEYFGGEVSDGFDRLAFLKLAALLHDVAKPVTKTVEASGRIRFLGHHTDGADVARDILTRLRFGKRGVEHIARMVRQHLRPRQMAQRGDMPTRRALYRYYRDVGDVALDTLYLNTADYLAARGPMLEREDWAAHCGLVRYILDEGRCEGDRCGDSVKSLPKLVDGYDIMNGFALAPGPFVGELLEEVREAQASGDVRTREQALELVRAGIERGGDGA
jgi:poly(A) polymerase